MGVIMENTAGDFSAWKQVNGVETQEFMKSKAGCNFV